VPHHSFMLRCLGMRLQPLALLLRCIATVQAPKDQGSQDFIISEHGAFQHNNPRLLRADFSKVPSRRHNDLWERFGFGSRLEDDASETHMEPARRSFVQEEWPTASYDAKDILPVSEPQQNIISISENQWPVNFCINATILAPDSAATPPDQDQKYMVIALLGGGPSVSNGTDSCGNFMLFVMYGNAVGMGVSASGKDWANRDCGNNGMSDTPIATTQNLTSFTINDLTFCYDSASMMAEIYVNGIREVSASKEFIFPREGSLTFLAGSHEKNQEVLQTTLSKFSISAYPTTTTTTTTGTAVTTTVTRNPDAPIRFHLPNTPRIAIDQRTAEISDTMWPEDFCVSVNISAPSVQAGSRTIALFGGDARCDSFAIFFADKNIVGMGGSCETQGPAAPLVTSASVGGGSHFISFCYAQQEGKASIIVDGQVVENDDRTWSYQRSGFVTVFGGSHVVGDTYQELQEATLWSMDMVECTPGQMPPLSSSAAVVGAAPPPGTSITTTVTSAPLNISEIIREALDATTENPQMATTTTTTLVGALGSNNGVSSTTTSGTPTTTTFTTTEEQTREHVVAIDNSTDVVTNHSAHKHTEDTSESDKTRTQGWSRHVEGDEQPGLLIEDEEEDDSPAIYNRYVPVDT